MSQTISVSQCRKRRAPAISIGSSVWCRWRRLKQAVRVVHGQLLQVHQDAVLIAPEPMIAARRHDAEAVDEQQQHRHGLRIGWLELADAHGKQDERRGRGERDPCAIQSRLGMNT